MLAAALSATPQQKHTYRDERNSGLKENSAEKSIKYGEYSRTIKPVIYYQEAMTMMRKVLNTSSDLSLKPVRIISTKPAMKSIHKSEIYTRALLTCAR
jgi:hypothetical protein